MIYVMFIMLIVILYFVYMMNKRDLFAPSFIFTLSFTLSCAWAAMYGRVWGMMNMNPITLIVIVGSVIEYVLIALFVKQMFKVYSKTTDENNFQVKYIKVDDIIKWACLGFGILVILVDLKYILNHTGTGLSGLKYAIKEYDKLYKLSNVIVKTPKLIGISLIILQDMGYWFLYVAINNYIAEKEIDVKAISITMCYIIMIVLNGSRAPAVSVILAGITIFYILLKKKNSYKNRLQVKNSLIIKGLIVFAIFVISFPQVARIMGRNITEKTMYYLAIYCGAEIKNLDSFITEYEQIHETSTYVEQKNNQTFANLINWWGPKVGLLNEQYKLDLPFRDYNGKSLGNVATTLYPYIYDYGYFGVIPCVAFMAFVCQYVYSKAKESKCENKVNIWILVYAYMFNEICLTFFSNKFYEQVFNKGFLFGLIFWNLANYFFIKYKISFGEKRRNIMKYDYLIVGAGLYGSVCAYELNKRGYKCLVIDKRDHIGGNIYTEKIEDINVHKYGAHIFHTNNKKVWDYVNNFAEFNRYTNSPIARYKDEVYNLPFNMNTFNKLWGVFTPEEAKKKIEEELADTKIEEPQNLEEQAIKLVGKTIYEKLIKGYTEKQWGTDANKLPAFIIKRLPVRFTYDNNYFNSKYQGIPIGGYTQIIEKMLNGIEVRLNCNYFSNEKELSKVARRMIFTGPIDEFYKYKYGPLEYRTVRFETETLDMENFQGNAVVNYTDREIPYTRIIEHKHFEEGKQPKTVISREYSDKWDMNKEPYYPVNNLENNNLYEKYRKLSEKSKKVSFGGRLGLYKYYDMDKIIEEALAFVEREVNG